MIFKLTLIPAALLLISTTLFAQRPPDEFFSGIEAISTDRVKAKKDMITTIAKMPAFHGAYHFLGVIYSESGQQDSAVYYLEKAVSLNTANINKTKEMSYVRLIEAYAYKQDFEKAFQTGWDAYKSYADNPSIASAFKDACLWSYYIKHTGLDKNYLSTGIKEEYVVTSISQEYLIFRTLRQDGGQLQLEMVVHQVVKKADYDVFKWTSKDNTEKEVRFKLDWDLQTQIGGRSFPKDAVIDNKAIPVSERVGALLVKDNKIDLKAEIEKMSL